MKLFVCNKFYTLIYRYPLVNSFSNQSFTKKMHLQNGPSIGADRLIIEADQSIYPMMSIIIIQKNKFCVKSAI